MLAKIDFFPKLTETILRDNTNHAMKKHILYIEWVVKNKSEGIASTG